MAAIDAMADALRSVAAPGMTPTELLAAVRARHPETGEKEVVRAACLVLIESRASDPAHLQRLHDFALDQPTSHEEVGQERCESGKSGKRRTNSAGLQPAA